MRLFFVAGWLAVTASGANSQVAGPIAQGTSSGDSCLPSLTMLRYPPPALARRIMGPVTTTLDIDTKGGINRLESKGHPLLTAGAEEALRSTNFDRDCWGRSIALRFSFRFDQDLDPLTPVSVKATSANEYEIIAPLESVYITISDPAWVFTRKGRVLHRFHRWLSRLRFW